MFDLDQFESYKGLDVVSSTRAGDEATEMLTDNFTTLADRAPYLSTSDPDSNDDSDAGYFKGSHWLNTTSNTMWVCVDATNNAAKWRSIYSRTTTELNLIPEDSDGGVDVLGYLKVKGKDNLDIGLEVNTPGSLAIFRNNSDNGSMTVYIEGKEEEQDPPLDTNKSAGFQLRNLASPGDDRTIVARYFQHHSLYPDGFQIIHRVNAVNVCVVGLTETGGFEVVPKDDVIFDGPNMQNFGIGTDDPKAKLHSTGSTVLGANTSEVVDNDLSIGELNITRDESGAQDKLVFRVKLSNGTVKQGEIVLT